MFCRRNHVVFITALFWLINCSYVFTRYVYYPADVTKAYKWSNSYPQSCSCAENGVTSTNCELFRCNCVCDVTAGKCDYDCCCDPDCSSDQISRFKSLGSCAYEGHEPDTTEYCYSSDELYGVNPRTPMGGQPAAEIGLSRALCVEKKNYAFPSSFYTSDSMQSSQIFQQPAGQKDYSYTEINVLDTSTIVQDSNYDQNDTISAFSNSSWSSTLISNGPGYLQIPSSNVDGSCNDNNYATFENSIPIKETTCTRTLAKSLVKFADQCVHQFSIDRYVRNLWIAKNANVMVSTGIWASNSMINVKLGGVVFEDYITKAVSDETASWKANLCSTASHSFSTYNATLDTCSLSSPVTKSVFTISSSAICVGFVKSVKYYVTHDTTAAATIKSVVADVVVTDVPMDYKSTEAVIDQSYGVEFYSVNKQGISNQNGNVVTRARSGNPGYLMGAPVVYGFPNDSATIKELVSGLTIPISPKSGSCPTNLAAVESTSTSFGYDSITGCSIHLNRQQFINFCCTGAPGSCLDNTANTMSGDSPYVAANGLAYFFNFTQGYIGIYGDADPLDIGQWFKIGYSIPADERQWNDLTATCSNAFSGLNIQFLVTYSGEKSNPQNKIVSAQAQVVTSDLIFKVPPGDNSTTQAFQLSVVVSYIFQDEEKLKAYEPPAPPVLFKVPYDVFYPFVVNSAPGGVSTAVLSNLFASVMVALALFCNH